MNAISEDTENAVNCQINESVKNANIPAIRAPMEKHTTPNVTVRISTNNNIIATINQIMMYYVLKKTEVGSQLLFLINNYINGTV